jgi:glycine/D-amino acid oxidase-like deaminating enzyme
MPRHAPLLIWADPQHVAWDDEARAWFGESDDTRWLLGEFPAGVHGRPDGPADSPVVLMLWPYHNQPVEVEFPISSDPEYPDVVLHGMATMLPGLRAYLARAPKPYIDGGYYLKTRENRPLIGPLPVTGAYLLGALSGFGLMAATGAGELLAAHIAGTTLPGYAPHFALERYDDPEYRALLDNWGDVGQL